MKWQVTGAKDAPADYLGGGEWEGGVKGWRGEAEAGMGVGELVENCIGIKVWRVGATQSSTAQHTLRREAHFNRYN